MLEKLYIFTRLSYFRPKVCLNGRKSYDFINSEEIQSESNTEERRNVCHWRDHYESRWWCLCAAYTKIKWLGKIMWLVYSKTNITNWQLNNNILWQHDYYVYYLHDNHNHHVYHTNISDWHAKYDHCAYIQIQPVYIGTKGKVSFTVSGHFNGPCVMLRQVWYDWL